MKRPIIFLVASALCSILASCGQKKSEKPEAKIPIQEGYPENYIEALDRQNNLINTLPHGFTESQIQSVISDSRRWKPGEVITIAFQGGNSDLRRQISDAVKPWSDNANVTFDFGYSTANPFYREWSSSDTEYRADIRISFGSSPRGSYWSAVGKDSVTDTVNFPPNETSMNFEGFLNNLPDNWRSTVVHEFGHALGFEHEHQSPYSTCEQEYRWDDDAGYLPSKDIHDQFVPDDQGRRPGIYTVLGGAPNRWSKKQIDFNLKKLPYSKDWLLSPFDKDSIMKYQFSAWMYRDVAAGTKSGCYSPEALVLSAQDQKAASEAYPRNPLDAKAVIDRRLGSTQRILTEKGLPLELKSQFQAIVLDLKREK